MNKNHISLILGIATAVTASATRKAWACSLSKN